MNSSQRDPELAESGEPPDVLVTLLHQELRRLAPGCLRRERPNRPESEEIRSAVLRFQEFCS